MTIFLVAMCLTASAGCTTEEFIKAYNDAASKQTDPSPEQMMDDDIERAGRKAVRGLDTSDLKALK